MRYGSFVAIAFGFLVLLFGRAYGHDPFEVTSNIRIEKDALEIEVTMLAENALLIANNGKQVTQPLNQEVTAEQKAVMQNAVSRLFTVTLDSTPLQPTDVQFAISDENDAVFSLQYPRPAAGSLVVDAIHLSILGEGHTNALTFTQNGATMAGGLRILHSADTIAQVHVAPFTSDFHQQTGDSALSTFKQFFVLGFEHILEGLDHLLFLAGVLIVCKGVKDVLILVTSFTVAHSLTLFLTAVNALTLPAIIVEPLIAASIVFIGLDNVFLPRNTRLRYILTFIFGLIHGLGFSAALQSMDIAQNNHFLVVIASFNLGVEAVQVLLALVILPFLIGLHRTRFHQAVVKLVSLAISVMGFFWFYRALS